MQQLAAIGGQRHEPSVAADPRGPRNDLVEMPDVGNPVRRLHGHSIALRIEQQERHGPDLKQRGVCHRQRLFLQRRLLKRAQVQLDFRRRLVRRVDQALQYRRKPGLW